MYMPTLARFTARDPLMNDEVVVMSPYHYAYSNPTNVSDPSGKQPGEPLPDNHVNWTCKPPRGRGGRGGYNLDNSVHRYIVFINTCCEMEVTVRVRARRCFRPGTNETGNDKKDSQNFYTEVVIRTTTTPESGICPDGSDEYDIACRVFPGRFISRLRTEFPGNMSWPDPDSDEMSDLEPIPQNACDAVKKTEPGRS